MVAKIHEESVFLVDAEATVDYGRKLAARLEAGALVDPEFVSRISRLIPLGRMAHRSEYRAAVQFLCSDASAYMTGQNLVIDGGRSVW